jgi:hypothetical protein
MVSLVMNEYCLMFAHYAEKARSTAHADPPKLVRA